MLLQRETVIMTNHNKDQYSCSIPIIEDNQEKVSTPRAIVVVFVVVVVVVIVVLVNNHTYWC